MGAYGGGKEMKMSGGSARGGRHPSLTLCAIPHRWKAGHSAAASPSRERSPGSSSPCCEEWRERGGERSTKEPFPRRSRFDAGTPHCHPASARLANRRGGEGGTIKNQAGVSAALTSERSPLGGSWTAASEAPPPPLPLHKRWSHDGDGDGGLPPSLESPLSPPLPPAPVAKPRRRCGDDRGGPHASAAV